jgi:3-methyladenine DNA glycosylase AlkD
MRNIVAGDIQRVARSIERSLGESANPARARFLAAGYAPTSRRVIGVSVPDLRRLVGTVRREVSEWPARDVVKLALALARGRTLEGRQAGVELLSRRRDALACLSRRDVERLGSGNDNWVSVDSFATLIVGPAWAAGQLTDADLKRWATSRDPWWRRTALVATVPLNLPSRGGKGDARRTLMMARCILAGAPDAMLVKALSWALRSLVPRDAPAVRRFLATHEARLPALVRREVRAKLETGKK